MKLTIPEQRGCCRWCGCTDWEPCEAGCAWTNALHTLYTECRTLDRAIRSKAGRAQIAEVLQGVRSVAEVNP